MKKIYMPPRMTVIDSENAKLLAGSGYVTREKKRYEVVEEEENGFWGD